MSRSILSIIAVFLFFATGFSKISVDFTGYSPSQMIAIMTNFGIGQFDSVIISHPFKMYQSPYNTDGIIYDWTDTGDKAQQGGISTVFGNLKGFKAIIDFLHKNNIKVFCKADIFSQYQDFNRNLWVTSDFIPDSINFLDYAAPDLEQGAVQDKLRKILNVMRELPVDQWIFDISRVPENLAKKYFDFIRGNAGWGMVYYEKAAGYLKDFHSAVTTLNYTELLLGILSASNRSDTSIYQTVNSGVYNFIPDKGHWFDHIGVGLFYSAVYPNTFIPGSFLSDKSINKVIAFFSPDIPYAPQIYDSETVVLVSKSETKIMGINFSAELSSLKIKDIAPVKGVIKSVFGNYPLHSDKNGGYIILPPGSVYLWEIK
ncbi:MAG: hypothetical protein HPY53_13275 [Brevinematales bacterium]|nr:hypothetical protein [Brevinematales bacterium]